MGIEPTTSGSGNRRASIAPRGLVAGKRGHGHAGARTQDLRLIRATLYRLSYTTGRARIAGQRRRAYKLDDEGFEPSTFRMQNGRSTTELNALSTVTRLSGLVA